MNNPESTNNAVTHRPHCEYLCGDTYPHLAALAATCVPGTRQEERATFKEAAAALSDIDRLRAESAALREAWERVVTDWQWGAWADAPRRADRVEERLANAQYVTDWLRDRSKAALSASSPQPPN